MFKCLEETSLRKVNRCSFFQFIIKKKKRKINVCYVSNAKMNSFVEITFKYILSKNKKHEFIDFSISSSLM